MISSAAMRGANRAPFEEANAGRRPVSPGTVRAYAADWAAFSSWCALEELESLPARLDTVLRYLLMMEADSKVSSQRRRLVAIRRVHRDAGHELDVNDPTFQNVWLAMSSRDRSDTRPRRRTLPDEVAQLICALPKGMVGVRDRALILTGWAAGCRPSELVGLDRPDVELTRRALKVSLRRARNAGAIVRQIEVERTESESLCPLRGLRLWITTANISSGPLFRPVNRHGRVSDTRLSVQAVRIVLRRAAQRAGLPNPNLTGDGLRKRHPAP